MWEFPNIDPVAIEIGPLVIRWYALAYLAGFLLGWKYCMILAGFDKDKRPNADDFDDFLPYAIMGVILGGRIGYILFYQLEFYTENPSQILMLWNGGMSFHGGALGVTLAMICYAYVKKISLLRLSDFVSAAVPIGIFFGRAANFINGELYGRVTDSHWGMVFPNGGPLPRHPSQLYESALEGGVLFLILFVLVRVKAVRNREGVITGAFLLGYGGFRFIVEYFREPDAHIGLIGGAISMGQILCIPMIICGLFFVAYGAARYQRVLNG